MNSPRPPIPDKAELFCHFCQRWKPRAEIVAAKWIRNGAQAHYTCRFCQDARRRREESVRRGG